MITILKNPKTEKYYELKEKVLSRTFFWQYAFDTNFDVEYLEFYEDLPYYGHTIIQRPSPEHPFPTILDSDWKQSVDVFNEIMVHNGLSYKTLYRLNFNSTFYVHDKMSPPHVDHDYPHQSLIVYLSKFNRGKTYVFKKKWPESEFNVKPTDIKHSFKGEEDDIIMFDGLHYHCMENPALNERRIVMIATFLI
jgi:hypothetical protein